MISLSVMICSFYKISHDIELLRIGEEQKPAVGFDLAMKDHVGKIDQTGASEILFHGKFFGTSEKTDISRRRAVFSSRYLFILA